VSVYAAAPAAGTTASRQRLKRLLPWWQQQQYRPRRITPGHVVFCVDLSVCLSGFSCRQSTETLLNVPWITGLPARLTAGRELATAGLPPMACSTNAAPPALMPHNEC
jgi:hypothetical protein